MSDNEMMRQLYLKTMRDAQKRGLPIRRRKAYNHDESLIAKDTAREVAQTTHPMRETLKVQHYRSQYICCDSCGKMYRNGLVLRVTYLPNGLKYRYGKCKKCQRG